MPTPKTEELRKQQEDAYKSNAADVKANADRQAEEMQANADTYVNQLKESNAALKSAKEKAVSDTEEANAIVTTYFGDLVKDRAEELQRAEEENKTLSEAERKAAAWTGAAELASSVVNLIGVAGFNAAPQTYHSYSQDWMKKADANRKERRSRIDNIRERQQEAEEQIARAKASGARDLAGLRYSGTVKEIEGADKIAEATNKAQSDALGIKFAAADKAAEAGLKGELAGINLGMKEIERQDAKDALDKKLTAQEKTAANRNSGKAIKVTFGASGELPEETMTINPQAMYNTILANRDSLGLTKEEEKELAIAAGDATGDALAKALIKFATTNPKLRALVRSVADSTDYVEPGDVGNPPADEKPKEEEKPEEEADTAESAEDDEETGLSDFK